MAGVAQSVVLAQRTQAPLPGREGCPRGSVELTIVSSQVQAASWLLSAREG